MAEHENLVSDDGDGSGEEVGSRSCFFVVVYEVSAQAAAPVKRRRGGSEKRSKIWQYIVFDEVGVRLNSLIHLSLRKIHDSCRRQAWFAASYANRPSTSMEKQTSSVSVRCAVIFLRRVTIKSVKI